MPADLFITAATIIAWTGAALLAIALLGDAVIQRVKRRRGTARKRCPKCWYDLSHAPGRESGVITCSECGRVVKRERHLYRGRKRWKLAALAIALLIASYAVRVTPTVRDRGWPAMMPTTVLILAMPWMQPTSVRDSPDEVTPWHLLSTEFEHRLRSDGALWSWQERLTVTLALRGDARRPPISDEWSKHYGAVLFRLWFRSHFVDGGEPWWVASAEELVQVEARTRSKWPVDSPIYVQFRIRRWDSRQSAAVMIQELSGPLRLTELRFDFRTDRNTRTIWWGDQRYMLGVADRSTNMLTVDALVEPSRRRTGVQPIRRAVQVPIHVEGTIHDYIEPVESEAISNYLRERLAPALGFAEEEEVPYLRLWRDTFMLTASVPPEIHGMTAAFRIEIMCNGVIVGTSEVWYAPTPPCEHAGEWIWWSPTGAVRVDGVDEEMHRSSDGDVWNIQLRGDPFVALRDFDATRYWKGEIELPLRVEVHER